MDDRDYRQAVNGALEDTTDIHDTHPCLSDRLAALGENLPVLEPVSQSGAEALLGQPLLAGLTQKLDHDWWSRAGGVWTERHAEAKQARNRIAELEDRVEPDSVEDWELQRLLETCGEDEQALALARRRLSACTGDVSAQLCVGRLLLEKGDAEGMEPLKSVLSAPKLRQPQLLALDHIVGYFRRFDTIHPERATYQARFDTALDWYQRVSAELDSLEEDIDLEPHDVPAEGVAALHEHGLPLRNLSGLWLAQRRLKSDADTTQFILLYELRAEADSIVQAFVDEALAMLGRHGNAFVVPVSGASEWLKRRMNDLDGARIIRR